MSAALAPGIAIEFHAFPHEEVLARSPRPATPLAVSVVTCAYNEEKNLPRFLKSILLSSGPSFDLAEIICVASGCTDRTVEIVRDAARFDPRVRLIVQNEREGKASAMNLGMSSATGEIVLIQNADTVALPGTVEAMVAPFRDPKVGLVCSHPVPASGRDTFAARVGRVLWGIHDIVSQLCPKAGEAFALRRTPLQIPINIEDDDTFLGYFVGTYFGRSVYAREGVVVNRVPVTVPELVRQRYRINRQILGLRRKTGMTTSTWRPTYLIRALWMYVRAHPRKIVEVTTLVALESLIRIVAITATGRARKNLRAWPPIESTKASIEPGTEPTRFGHSREPTITVGR